MGQGRRKHTPELYEALLEAYRREGKNHSLVGRLCGVDRATSKVAWERGWVEVEGAVPISKTIELERILARATRAGTKDPELAKQAEEILNASPLVKENIKRAHELEQKAIAAREAAQKMLDEAEGLAKAKVDNAEEQARQRMALAELEAKQRLSELLQRAKVDAAETLADEANAAKFGRKAALSAVAIAALVMKDAQTMAGELKEAINGKLKNLSPVQAVRVMHGLARLVESAEKAVILSLQAERLRLGQPTEVVGVTSLVESSLEEKEIKLRALMQHLERKKAHLKLVQGGNGAAPTGGNGVTNGHQVAATGDPRAGGSE